MVSEHVKKKKFAKQRWEDLSTCWSVFNETIIPLRRVGCEMIIANLPYRPGWTFTISYPMRACGIIV